MDRLDAHPADLRTALLAARDASPPDSPARRYFALSLCDVHEPGCSADTDHDGPCPVPAPIDDEAAPPEDSTGHRYSVGELQATTDATAWASEFAACARGMLQREHPDNLVSPEVGPLLASVLDQGWLIGWFANALETGRTHGVRAEQERAERARAEAAEWWADDGRPLTLTSLSTVDTGPPPEHWRWEALKLALAHGAGATDHRGPVERAREFAGFIDPRTAPADDAADDDGEKATW